MATVTLGTNATTTLTALINSGSMSAADVATICNSIKDDKNAARPIFPGAYSAMDQLYIPNRGVLTVLPGDYVGVDSRGWPILVSADSIANGPWTHS